MLFPRTLAAGVLAALSLVSPRVVVAQGQSLLYNVPFKAGEGGAKIYRITSHEIGHALGLQHRQDTTNLMASGTTGFSLNEAEFATARAKAHERLEKGEPSAGEAQSPTVPSAGTRPN